MCFSAYRKHSSRIRGHSVLLANPRRDVRGAAKSPGRGLDKTHGLLQTVCRVTEAELGQCARQKWLVNLYCVKQSYNGEPEIH